MVVPKRWQLLESVTHCDDMCSAADMKKEHLPRGPKQKAYYIGHQKEDSFHLIVFNRNYKFYLILDSQLFYVRGTFLIFNFRKWELNEP